jgi:hypothetical protein
MGKPKSYKWGYGDRRPIKKRFPFFLCPLSLAHDRDGVEIMSNNTNE